MGILLIHKVTFGCRNHVNKIVENGDNYYQYPLEMAELRTNPCIHVGCLNVRKLVAEKVTGYFPGTFPGWDCCCMSNAMR